MTDFKRLFTLVVPAMLLMLSACATGFSAQVSRFQAMPAPQGQSFAIKPANPKNEGSLEFAHYADMVRQHLIAQGYAKSTAVSAASLIVSIDYGVDNGRTQIETIPHFGFGFGYGPFGPRYPHFGYYGRYRSPFYFGWEDPFWDEEIDSYTVYTSYLDMDIKRASDGQSLFEGTAKARSRTDKLQALVPNLIEALFTGFPGNSGETVKITIPPPSHSKG